MSAQPIHEHQPPRIPNTIAGIRLSLPAQLRAQFQDEIDAATDSGDMNRVDAVKSRWWAQALWATDASIDDTFAALDRGDAAIGPSPFAGR